MTRLGIAAFIAALGPLTGISAAVAADEPLRLAQPTDVRQEDRRADRRMDPADNREVRVPLPRNTDGTIDVTTLLTNIDARVDAGAREIQIRRDSLTPDEARALLLTPEGRDLLVRIGALLPNDGVERNVTFRGATDARVRVQREPNGSLRLIVRDIDTGRRSKTSAKGGTSAPRGGIGENAWTESSARIGPVPPTELSAWSASTDRDPTAGAIRQDSRACENPAPAGFFSGRASAPGRRACQIARNADSSSPFQESLL